jgi:hypothetical protein
MLTDRLDAALEPTVKANNELVSGYSAERIAKVLLWFRMFSIV